EMDIQREGMGGVSFARAPRGRDSSSTGGGFGGFARRGFVERRRKRRRQRSRLLRLRRALGRRREDDPLRALQPFFRVRRLGELDLKRGDLILALVDLGRQRL